MAQVGIRELRNNLSKWIRRAEREEVIVTDRGKAVARLTGVDTAGRYRDLVDQGVVQPPRRPRLKPGTKPRVRAKGPVSPFVAEQRR